MYLPFHHILDDLLNFLTLLVVASDQLLPFGYQGLHDRVVVGDVGLQQLVTLHH